jgi:hypothetical protein
VHLTLTPTHRPALHLPAVHRSSFPVAAALLAFVYLAAIAVAVAAPGERTAAGLVVLAGLTARVLVRRHRSTAAALAATEAVPPAAPAVTPAVP